MSGHTLSLRPTMPCSVWIWTGAGGGGGSGGACQPGFLHLFNLFCLALVAVSGLWTTTSALSGAGIGPVSLGSCRGTTGHGRNRQSKAAAGSAAAAAAASEILFPRFPASIP